MSWLRPIDAWFASAILPHETALLDRARHWATDECEARDLLHEAYAQILQLESWDHIANPMAYMVRTMRNNALQRLRRARIVPMRPFTEQEAERPDPAPDSFSICADRAALSRLAAAIDRLPPACRRVVLLRKIEELPPRAIAERLDISLSTVEKHLARGLSLLVRWREADQEDVEPPVDAAIAADIRQIG
jgi:RNA polymerase sigma factor (sigma-70 family)